MRVSFVLLFLMLVLIEAQVSSFLLPVPTIPGIRQSGTTEAFSAECNRDPSTTLLKAYTTALDASEIDDSAKLLRSSILVGSVTAALGFVYGLALDNSVKLIWSTLPAQILKRVGVENFNPAYFITSVTTFGGLLMAALGSKFNSTFTVADFVSSFSFASAKKLPSAGANVFPLLLMSLVTSVFGFSVGPEAPMVCAGALVGASLSRRLYCGKEVDPSISAKNQETLAYAGAAGALTAFMGIPIAGSIFALEMTRSDAGLSKASERALSPAVMSSIAALVVIRGILSPSATVGGHFNYGTVGDLSGRAMICTAIACGAGGATIGTVFHKFVAMVKGLAWAQPSESPTDKKNSIWKRQLLVKALVGLTVGIISSNYPQTLFWGEGSLQTVVDGHRTAFSATHHGLSDILTSAARVNPSNPFSGPSAAAQVGVAKLVSIALACAGKFPGGIIFPLFFAAAPIAHAFCMLVGIHQRIIPVAVMCLMASTQASVTRTPLATALILSFSASSATQLSVMLPALVVSSYLGVFLSRIISRQTYFTYNDS